MNNIKAHVYDVLSKVGGAQVSFFYPEDFKKLPCISFYENASADGAGYDNHIIAKDCIIQVDIWAKKYTQTDDIVQQVYTYMEEDGWRCGFESDIAKAGEHAPYHHTMRFRKQIYF